MLLCFKHCIGTAHGASKGSYGGIKELFGGTGQINDFQEACAEMHHVSSLKKWRIND